MRIVNLPLSQRTYQFIIMQLPLRIKSTFCGNPKRLRHGGAGPRGNVRLAAAVLGIVISTISNVSTGQSQNTAAGCEQIKDEAARRQCWAQSPSSSIQHENSIAGWRMIRTRDPHGGPDAISITRSADAARSDVNFAGLMIRCSAKDPEILLVLVAPLPPLAHPKIVLGSSQGQIQMEARVVSPGVLVLLPDEAAMLLRGPWQRGRELTMVISYQQASTSGVVSLEGLSIAYPSLVTSCQLPRN